MVVRQKIIFARYVNNILSYFLPAAGIPIHKSQSINDKFERVDGFYLLFMRRINIAKVQNYAN